ncbi:MAG: hypothetical protein C3F02_04980 [Parcubacteria group bacterium]|nr:MAG: hypothetical protein C3F02_04980 [Parcubacteria group bacterium]
MTEATNFDEKTDAELVELTLKNQDIFLYLIRRYEKKLLSYIFKITNVSYEDAEDILQEVFIKVYVNLNNFDRNLKFSSWIYRIAHNEVINNFRHYRARPQTTDFDGKENWLTLAYDSKIDKDIDVRWAREHIDIILSALDLKYREVLILKYFEEKSYEEISDILKKPAGTVATLLNRAKANFKQALEKMDKNIKL